MTTLTALPPARTPATAVRPGRVGRWLLVTRAPLVPLTVLAAVGAGALGLGTPGFRAGPLALAVVGVLLAHLLGALLGRLSDPDRRLVDLVGRRSVGLAVLGLAAACLVVAVVLALQRGGPVLALVAAGAVVTLVRAGRAAGARAAAALVSGPLVVAGAYVAATGALPWQVWLAGVPFGLLWAGLALGSQPGLPAARVRHVVLGLLVGCYAATGVAVAVEALPWPALLVVLALPPLRRAAAAVRARSRDRPPRRAGLWVAPASLGHARAFTALLVLGLLVAVATSTGLPPASGGP